MGDNGTVPGFEQVHISYRALGCLAAAPYIIFWSHALEVDVPAVELALRHDELGGEGRLGIDDGGLGLLLRTGRSGFSLFVFCGFGGFLCHDFEVFGGLRSEPRLLIFTNNQKCGRNELPKARVITLLQELAPKEGGTRSAHLPLRQ